MRKVSVRKGVNQMDTKTYVVVVSKGEAVYEIEAASEEEALEQAEEFYDERDFTTSDITLKE